MTRRLPPPRVLPARVRSTLDAVLRAGGGACWSADPSGPVRFSGARPDDPVPDLALGELSSLRGAICHGDGTWTWSPDLSSDVALEAAPFSDLFAFRRAS